MPLLVGLKILKLGNQGRRAPLCENQLPSINIDRTVLAGVIDLQNSVA